MITDTYRRFHAKKKSLANARLFSEILPGGDLLFHTTKMQYHRP